MSIKDKNKLVDRLSIVINRIDFLLIYCSEYVSASAEEKNELKMAVDKLEANRKLLFEYSTQLLRSTYKEWESKATDIRDTINKSIKILDTNINKIESTESIAKTVVSCIGSVDDVVNFLKSNIIPFLKCI